MHRQRVHCNVSLFARIRTEPSCSRVSAPATRADGAVQIEPGHIQCKWTPDCIPIWLARRAQPPDELQRPRGALILGTLTPVLAFSYDPLTPSGSPPVAAEPPPGSNSTIISILASLTAASVVT